MSDIIIDYIIIGGGLSGIAAGRKLLENNASFFILEARDTIGGRTCTYSKGDYKVDIGASWVGKHQPVMFSLCKQLNIPLIQQYEGGRNILLLEGQKIIYTGLIPKLGLIELISYGWGQFKLDRLAMTVNLKEPIKTKNALYLDSITFDTYLKERFRKIPYQLVARGFELVFGTKVSQISLLHALQYIKSGKGVDSLFLGIGGAQEFKIEGGSNNFTNKFAEVVKDRILLNHAVLEIDDGPLDLVRIRTMHKTFRCKKVIVSAPARVLQNIKFLTPLPLNKQFLIKNQRSYGHVYKFNLIYDRPFWREAKLSGQCISPQGILNMTFDGETDPNAKYYKLIGFLDQDFVEDIGREAKKEITAQLMKELEIFFGPEVYNYRDIIYGDLLSSDKYIGGCPTGVLAPLLLTTHGQSMETSCGRLYWAGTETSEIWQGFMEGAVRSGYRAANQVLGLEINEPVTSQRQSKYFIFIAFLLIIIAYMFY